ncbi:SNF2 family N-terminal domain-containing protein [Amylostereum chailletii]|nr:SNF2 family N-terminal domain-containing protein [Amylostereum chailletii]
MALAERDLIALAEKHLGFSSKSSDPDQLKRYLPELREHVRLYPNDTNFLLQLSDDADRSGRVFCLEDGCKVADIELWSECDNQGQLCSLSSYRSHIRRHPTHRAARNERINKQETKVRVTMARPTMDDSTKRGSQLKPRPVLRGIVKKEDPDFDQPIISSMSRKRSLAMVKQEPDVIELSDDDDNDFFQSGTLPSSPSPVKKQKVITQSKDIKPLQLTAAAPPSKPSDVVALREEAAALQQNILNLDRRIQMIHHKSRKSKADLTRLKKLELERAKLVTKKADLGNRIPTLAPRPESRDGKPRVPLLVKAEPSLELLPGRALPVVPSTPKRTPSNAQASGSNVKLSPSRRLPTGGPVLVDIKPSILNSHIEDPVPAFLKPRDPVEVNDHLNAFARVDDDPYDENGDYFGRGKDTFNGPVAQADDIEKFLVDAGNAELFDGNVKVGDALRKLGLPDLVSLLPGMTVALMPYQAIGVAWMLERERGTLKGGCLADEMGLGKTVQTIATMVSNRPTDPSRRSTLIIGPVALLSQWQTEIAEKTNCGMTSLIYHGSNKPKHKADLQQYDFVLTSHSTVAREWPDPDEEDRKLKKKKKAAKKGLEFIVSDDDSDEPQTKKPRKKQAREGLLLQMEWYRIVLDEAHVIRSKKTRLSRAVSKLTSTIRWALTGTPIVNGLADAYPILRFLQIRPWYDWKEFNDRIARIERKQPALAASRLQSIYRTVQLRRKKDSLLDGKALIDLPKMEIRVTRLEFSEEERTIYTMVETQSQAKFNRFLRAGTVLKNYHQVLTMLLRLRQLCSHPCLIQENADAKALHDEFDEGRSSNSKDELTRAAELVSAAFVAKVKHQRKEIALKRITAEKEGGDVAAEADECPICFDNLTDAVVTPCTHVFCRECLDNVFNLPRAQADGTYHHTHDRDCPSCRSAISKTKLFTLSAFEPTDAELNPTGSAGSSKAGKVKSEETSVVRSVQVDSDIEMLNSEAEEAPVKAKGKSKGKGKAIKKRAYNSEDDSEHAESDDGMSDFIVEDDEDDEDYEENAARRRLRKRLSKGKKRAIVLDSDDEWEEEETEVVFGRPKKITVSPEEMKLMPSFMPSTKMKQMMDTLVQWSERHPDEKVLIISQWTQCLDLVSDYLSEKNFVHVKYQGNMVRAHRDKAVQVFMSRDKAKIMLMSLKCGGVGLNLTRANRMICLDLAWSEAVENQAWSRVHRLGQAREVVVERFVIADTVEDRILALQERKRLLAEGSLGEGDGKKLGRLTVRDLTRLFGLGGP